MQRNLFEEMLAREADCEKLSELTGIEIPEKLFDPTNIRKMCRIYEQMPKERDTIKKIIETAVMLLMEYPEKINSRNPTRS